MAAQVTLTPFLFPLAVPGQDVPSLTGSVQDIPPPPVGPGQDVPHPVGRRTYTSENISFRRTTYVVGKNQSKNWIAMILQLPGNYSSLRWWIGNALHTK